MKKLRILLQDDIEYATKCINDNSTTGLGDSFKYINNDLRNNTHSDTRPVCPSQSLNISNSTSDVSKSGFLEKNYMRGGMCPLVDMRQHPEWVPGYKKHV